MSGSFDGCNEYGEDITMDQNSRQEAQVAAADMVSIASDMCEAELTTPPPPVDGSGVGCPCAYNGLHAAHHHHQGPPSVLMVHDPPPGDKRKRLDEPADPATDSDEHFALSCVAALRRLPIRKNAEMRMRILHMLYEAEYGEEPAFR